MKAGVIKGINKLAVEEYPIPEIKPGTALVKVHFAALCGPTDDAILKGLHPRARFPLIACHEFSGEISAIDSEASYFKPGDHVVINPLVSCSKCGVCREGNQYICENLQLIGIDCNGGFAEYCAVPVENLVKLPDTLELNVAALAEPMAVGVHAVVESGLHLGNTALIYGAGPIGLFVAEACRYAGASLVTIVDINEKRLEFAESLGFSVINNSTWTGKDKLMKFDYVFETTGSDKVLKDAVELVRIKGTIMIVGKFDYDALFDFHTVLFNEITVKGARVYRQKEFMTAVDILSNGSARYEAFISDYISIEQFEEVFKTFRTRKNLSRIVVAF